MLQLSGIEESSTILQLGIHRVTNKFRTGALIKDYDLETARRMLLGNDYYKFSVIRDPVDRTISAYYEKFVLNRTATANQEHTRDPVCAVQGGLGPDYVKGISFREFVNFIVTSDPSRLDVHWGPQVLFLAGVDKYDDVFALEHLDKLAARLSAIAGEPVELETRNQSLSREKAQRNKPGRYVDLSPKKIEELGGGTSSDFMDQVLVEQLKDYFQEDLELYEAAKIGLSNYQPKGVSLENVPTTRELKPLEKPEGISLCVNLYTKGFFTMDAQGRGSLNVMIFNGGRKPIDFRALNPNNLEYTVNDAAGRPLHEPQRQSFYHDLLDRQKSLIQTLNIQIPESLLPEADNIVIKLRLDDSFPVEEIAPLHVASANLIRPPLK